MGTRRNFLTGAVSLGAATAAFPAVIAPARAATPVTFTTPFGFDPTFIDIMNAASGGHFAAAGLAAKIVGPPGTSQAFQLVLAGEAQFGLVAGIDFIRIVGAKGAPLVAIATIGQKSGFHLVSLKERPVRSGADLRGKTVGVLSIGGLTETMVDILLATAGVPKGAAKVVVAGNSPGEVELIRQGRIDCFLCNFPVTFTLQKLGAPVEYLSIDTAVPAPGQLYYTTRAIAANNPALVTAVLRALRASVLEIMSAPLAPIYRRAAKDFEIPRSKDLDTLAALQQAIIAQLWLSAGKENLLRNVPATWQSGVESLRRVGVADVKDATTLYTNSFLDTVMKG